MNRLVLPIVLGAVIFSSCGNGRPSFQKVGYAGDDITEAARIERDRETQLLTLHVLKEANWKLYSGTSTDEINLSKPILEGKGVGKYTIDLPDTVRYYFQYSTSYGKGILAERRLPMEGGYNFRDIGGVRTKEGKYVKWGKIFRSDDLYKLTDKDLQYLSSIPLVSVVDFRSEDEIMSAPDRLPVSVKNHYSYSILPGNLQVSALSGFGDFTIDKMDTMMTSLYRELVTDSVCISRYKDFFALLADETKTPLLYHCTAGKDRTGVATALLLTALGVDERNVFSDYLISNYYLEGKYTDLISAEPALKAAFEVNPQYLYAAFELIRSEYGSIEHYLKSVLNVNVNKLKEIYLY